MKIKVNQKKKVTFKKKRANCSTLFNTKKLVEYLRKELKDCTTHGLPYIVNQEIHWFERLFWAASFVSATAIIYVLLSSQYIRYMEAPIVMSVEKDYFNWNISFPAIILCPLDKIDNDSLAVFLNDTREEIGQDLEDYIRALMSVSLESLHLLRMPDADILSYIEAKNYAKISADLFKKFDNTSLSTVTKWPMSVETAMTEMGMCHIINSNIATFDNPNNWDNSELTYAKTNIELSYHDRDFFVQILNYADEYKIYINNPDDLILTGAPELKYNEEGFLSFGVHTSSIKASQDIRLIPIHLRKCRFMEETHSKRYPVYSYNRCMMECRINIINKFCGCIPYFYKPLDEKVCSLAEMRCVLFHMKEIMKFAVSNESMATMDDVTGLPTVFRECGCLGDCEAFVYNKDHETFLPQEAMNRLRISVSSFPKVRFVREIIFGFYDIIVRSGGVVNLCIGTSVISIMELLLTAIRIPIYGVVQLIQMWRKNSRKGKALVKKSKKVKIK
ncbi:sodium channel protein Nach [Manduca sexta]|uniref:sodium channel protein Nach n=1 Tax=Manduca sexta TaxID=7130 RepID=UPI0018900B76|nr:sodium channel protein Nach [Manduca sexta]